MKYEHDMPCPPPSLPAPWALLLRRMGRRCGVDLRETSFGEGRPWPRVKNEDGTLELGRVFLARGTRLWAHKGGTLSIGDGTVLDENVEIVAWNRVTVGSDCYLGWEVLVMDTDLHEINGQPLDNRPVSLGDRVHVGCRAVILKGVTIGDGAVIHPGAIVTRDVPAGGEARGAEATQIRRVKKP